jgi:tRNA threonylcarbamoyladenosine biosynthesis protein TsaE
MAAEPPRRLISSSPESTRALGAALGRRLPAGTLVALDGELGSGKTCFVQGLARGLDVPCAVTSPTYALLQTYPGRVDLHHFDAYMEGRERALLMDGGLEWMGREGVAAVEWAGRVEDVLPLPRISVVLAHAGESRRRLSISVLGEGPEAARLAAILRALAAEGEIEAAGLVEE